MKQTESFIQQQCLLWFNNTYCLKFHNPRFLIFSVPNEGESAYETKRKKRIGLLPGASDMIIVAPGKTFFLEFKTSEGRQSAKQKDFQQRVEALGHKYFVVRSLESFKEICKTHIISRSL